MSEVHKCPVCYGAGNVDAGLYTRLRDGSTSNLLVEQCRSFGGRGYLVIHEQPPIEFDYTEAQ